MQRGLIIAILSFVMAGAAMAQGSQQKSVTDSQSAKAPQSTPTVDQILDRYVQAIGGAGAHSKLTSRVTMMTLAIEDSDVTVSFESYAQAPNKQVLIGQVKLGNGIEFEISRGFNGAIGWSLNATEGGFRELSGTELASEKRDNEYYREIKVKEIYATMALMSQAPVGDHTVYCIEATPSEGSSEKWFFEAQTGLLIRKEFISESAVNGKVPVVTSFEDYREVDGVKLPFTVRMPSQKYTFKVNRIWHNLSIEDAKFKSPGAAFDELSISRVSGSGRPATRTGVLYLSLQSSGNQVSIRAELDEKNKSFTLAKGADEIASRLKMVYSCINEGEARKADIKPVLEEFGALIYKPIADLVDSSAEIQFVIPGRFLSFPLDLLHFKGRPLFLQKPVTYSFDKIESGHFPLSSQRTALIISDKSSDPENGCKVLKDILPLSDYYYIEDMNLARLSTLQAADVLLISAHGWVQFANTDSMGMGIERLQPDHLTHLSPKLVYLDSCQLGVSAQFIQSFRNRGTQFYVAPILSNEAGNSSTKTIAFFFERLKAGDTPSKALFYTRKKLYEFDGEKEGFNKLLFRAFPFRVYSLN